MRRKLKQRRAILTSGTISVVHAIGRTPTLARSSCNRVPVSCVPRGRTADATPTGPLELSPAAVLLAWWGLDRTSRRRRLKVNRAASYWRRHISSSARLATNVHRDVPEGASRIGRGVRRLQEEPKAS